MSTLTELEFLLVSNDYATLTAVSGGVKKYGAKLGLVPTAEAAREYLERKKIDGVFVDMQVSGMAGLMEAVRKGTSNGKTAIFAVVQTAGQTTATLNAGANFVLRTPLSVEGVALHITIAKDIMLRERRRFFRHAVNLVVILKDSEGEQRGRIINLSEGGMAVRAVKMLKQWTVLEFAMELAPGVDLSGKGQVAWTSSDGMAGILFQTLRGMGRGYLGAWLAGREQLSRKTEEHESPR
ncbi:MAG TPA: PilZ domain-containing protein [Verrucomicrobiae bacterium]|jgi:CheY-like chemotaxis protein|nr:PilZ domain-containing protein [Verrucomicrobiae bacterium]